MILENIQMIEAVLKIKRFETGYKVRIELRIGEEISVLSSEEIYPDKTFALAVGKELMKKVQNDFNLSEYFVH